MNYKKVKRILIKSNIKVAIIAIIVLFLGGLAATYPFFNSETNFIVTSLFGGIFILIGVLILWKTLPAIVQAKTEKHPLLNAIKIGEKDYIVWLYKKEIITSVEGIKAGTSNNVIYLSKDCKGKAIELTLSKKDSADSFIEYLSGEFNIPYVGYDNDIREAINKEYSLKGWKKV